MQGSVRMPKKISRIAIASAFFTATLAAHAAFFTNSDHRQYLSGNLGLPYVNHLYSNGNTISGFTGFGGALFLGEQINHIFGPELELQYDTYGESGELLLFGASGRATLNFNDRVNLFAKLGIGYGQARACGSSICATDNNVVPIFGGGMGVYITPQWLGSIEFNGAYFANSTVDNADGVFGVLTVGVTRFFED